MKIMTIALVLALGVPTTLSAQEDPDSSQARAQRTQRPVLQAAEMKTYYFTPQFTSSRELKKLASRIYGRQIFIADRGGMSAPPVENLQELGDTILIYDTEEYAQMLGEALHGMDEAMAANRDEHAQPQISTIVETWRPSHISLRVATSALGSFRRDALVIDERGNSTYLPNMSIVDELGQLVLRDTPEQVAEMLAMLKSIDLPEQQLYLTCLIIRGQHEPATNPAAVPTELASNLSKLVPFEHFELVSMGVLRASAMSGQLELRMDNTYRMGLENQGFDPKTKSLTANCRFEAANGQSLETRTTIRAGEYTVLGATGASPLFAVLKIEPVDL